MIPTLYDSAEREFRTNGIGRLYDCIRCIVKEERDGVYECEFDYPVTGQHYSDIKEGCIIYCIHDDTKKPQPFDIYRKSAPLNGIVTFYAHHISYRLGNVILTPFRASSCAQVFAMIPGKSVNENPFTFWTDKETTGEYSVTAPVSVKEMLGGTQGSVLDVYGKGDYEWDGWDVKLYLNRGRDTDVQVRYGKNLSDIVYERDAANQYSAVAPYWRDPNGGVVMLPEIIYVPDDLPTETSDLMDNEGDYLVTETGEQLEALSQVLKPVPLDLSDQFERQPSDDAMRRQAQAALEGSWDPDINIRVDFVQLWQTPEYEAYAPLQRVNLCDKVSVYYPELGVIAEGQQVIEVTYDVLTERYESMQLGKAKTSFAQALRADIENGIISKVPSKSFLEESVNRATELIRGGLGGFVVIGTNADGQPNEILIMDTDDVNTAVNVIRMNREGIGFSTTGYEGPFNSAWTIDGHFVADYIDTGTLNANLLKTGIISDREGKNYWNLETGEFSISLEPGEEGEVTQADLRRVENNARTYANQAESNAKLYVDNRGYQTETQVDNKIAASAAGLETKFSTEYSAKGDTTVSVSTFYYKSTSSTTLHGGSWSTASPAWEDGYYVWQKIRYIKGDGTYTESEPVCLTGNTGRGENGEDGDSAFNLWWSADNTLSTPKESPVTVTLTAHVGKGESDDIDPKGVDYDYAWFISRDNGEPELFGRGKSRTISIDKLLCDDRADLWFGLATDETEFYVVDEVGDALTDHEGKELEVA